jgi:putative transcriptional regulator
MAIRILLSNKLGELRWTQADLARKTGIRPATVNELYHELTDRINLRHFEKICEVLRCEFTDIVVREEDQVKRERG